MVKPLVIGMLRKKILFAYPHCYLKYKHNWMTKVIADRRFDEEMW